MNLRSKSKNLSFLLALVLLISFCPVQAKAASEYTYQLTSDGTLAITGYTGLSANLEIPEEIDGIKVTAIADHAFEYQYSLKEVKIPEGVTSVGEGAFNDCSGLVSVVLPDSVTSIGKDAFFSCTRLESIDFSDSLYELGDGAFYHCMSLESVTLPGTLEDFGDYTFGACSNLESAVLQEGITEIPQQTFFDCTSLSNVTLPQSLQTIEMRAFSDCSALTSLSFPDRMELIGKRAFENVPLTDICVNARSIETNAFSAFTLTPASVSLGEQVEHIAPQAFNYYSLGSYQVDEQNPYYTVDNSVLYTKDKKELVSCPSQLDTTNFPGNVLELPSGVEIIRPYAFYLCQNLDVIVLPDSVTRTGDYAFAQSSVKTVFLSQNITDLGAYTFYGCGNLVSITIPSKITELKECVFAFCPSLAYVALNDQLQAIGDWAFRRCASLNTLQLPASLEKMNGSAFSECSSSDSLTSDFFTDTQPVDEMESDSEDTKNEESILIDSYNAVVSTLSASNSFQLEVSDKNPYFMVASDGNLYSKDGTALIAYLNPVSDSMLQIPENITTLKAYSILSSQIEKIEIPSSVTEIEENSVGYFADPSAFSIYGAEDSVAMDYARQHNFAFFTGEPEVNATELSLTAGETFQYTISNVPAEFLGFASSDNQVASVDQNGMITAKANGTAEIFAQNGSLLFSVAVTVTGGEDSVDPYASFKEIINKKEVSAWEKTYIDYNQTVPLTREDNININDYSSNNYIAIKAKLIGGAYIESSDSKFEPGGYEQFETVAKNLGYELSRYRLNSDLRVYSGTNDISFITGGGSSLQEMLDSVGKTVTDPCVISTSLTHDVAVSHGKFMLEIYAPRDLTNGAYINPISEYQNENELLLNYNLTYKVLDAGIRNAQIPSADYTYTSTEYYIKLLLNPQPDPEEPDSPETPDNPDTPNTPDSPDTDTPSKAPSGSGDGKLPANNTAPVKQVSAKIKKADSPDTGDSSASHIPLFLFLSGSSGMILVLYAGHYLHIFRKRKSF